MREGLVIVFSKILERVKLSGHATPLTCESPKATFQAPSKIASITFEIIANSIAKYNTFMTGVVNVFQNGIRTSSRTRANLTTEINTRKTETTVKEPKSYLVTANSKGANSRDRNLLTSIVKTITVENTST